MIHPIFKLLAAQPELLAQHLGGYVALVHAQLAQALTATRLQLVWLVVCVISATLGLGLAGVAALLAAALPAQAMPSPWALWALPGAVLLVAAASGWALTRRPTAWSLDGLRQQAAADLALLHEAGQ